MAGPEYFGRFRPELLPDIDIDKFIKLGLPFPRSILIPYLSDARNFLITSPGPNLNTRETLAPSWLGWWIDYLENSSADQTGKIIPFEEIKNSLDKDTVYGALFAGGLEGHSGHRFAVDWMIRFVKPVLLLERDWYIESKPRAAPFLDLKARISMWTNYDPGLMVSVLPEKPADADPSVHYKKLFDSVGAQFCFASESDPNWQEKVVRGNRAWYTRIPGLKIASTSDGVRKLMPDIDIEELLNRLKDIK